MSFSVKEITNKKDLKKFIKFPFELYEGNDCYVTPLIEFEESTLQKDKNPAFANGDAKYWLAEREGEIVGRIAAIILNKELKENRLSRFGWIDFIDDLEVSRMLLDTAKEWVIKKGAKAIHGPMGFTDLDFEGALVNGFDKLATQATIYNHSYYIDHYKAWGLETSATWIEIRGKVPKDVPRRITRSASIVKNRFSLKVKEFKNAKQILKYAPGVFEVLNEAYAELYGYQKLTEKQVQYYVDQYFGFVRKEFVCIVVNEEDQVVGFALSLPSLSKAFQKAKGSLIPFGFIHVLQAFYFNKHVDMFLIGVKPKYQKMGANALIFENLTSTYVKKGIKYVSTGPMLEENRSILNSFNDYDLEPIKIKRCCFRKDF
ncbi:MAG: hypothetical protein AAGC64_03940 [Bacteroidota bacterium]